MGPKAASTTKKTTTTKPKPNHPTYQVMISHAIAALKERFGSSQPAIIKYIENNYNVGDSENFKRQLRLALKRLLKDGVLVQIKASYKLSEEGKKAHKSEGGAATKKPAAATAVVKKPVSKKPAAKKPAETAAPKKPAARRVTKKPAAAAAKKNAAKKPTAAPTKKAAGKPAARKAPAKK
ncbi:hypothetical protein DICPUDRAFT_96773 [Dictyostelium purpureum]|uniref:H15 domain-containing protein n=1 Tax=Dictyostelium purpureum TaxID=5786 RepID=F0ZB33_DICPU|nr:uncharacterized protein DICPUDRAFT_96773 [Dictyostelium purpureum]EGC38824.1 hypothetical protein DICPUDRAFT_96773 [Dictyostelium purpureum]|eukprot:XP_003284618.1 hypothetical protein DICPUDRAFT_96773 [Dictyostelium purpureum]